ncbi:GTPase IMAP family member 7-like [Solea senegalensis]|uniref:GTPase IMAP family member 7-like n=1 Tax=Solea senegalensis TaxID=28829 RepID=A0AAV6PRR5_SOLSE|nr:GTPase IMAP family member 7 [Solea senegalensis]XP_043891013.1 GTPase IMAP family member 7 [Solea senegalensis]KAG7474040.1 GTPase IMAP family member 7-like [Solea senegalensis]
MSAAAAAAAAPPQSELRLVVLGRAGAGKSSAASTILRLEDPEQGTDTAVKHRGEAAGRQVVIVSGPAWFGSACDPEERRKHISSVIALSSPGPHAFLLCVPVNQPIDGEDKALDVLTALFGSAAVARNTIVLFTHTEELEEDENLDEYLVTWRKDLQELVERCGGRYHTLETRGREPEEGKAVEELLQKVEQVVEDSETQHLICPLYQEAEERVRERQVEVVRQRRADKEVSPTDTEQEENITEEEMEAARDEAERSVGDLNVDVEDIFPPTSVSPSSTAPSFLWGLWVKLTGWLRALPKMVRREALFGALVGLFVGGPIGGMVGATVGSVATEVSRRKTQKTK